MVHCNSTYDDCMLQIGFTFSWFVHPYTYMQQFMGVVVLFVRDKCLKVYLSYTEVWSWTMCTHSNSQKWSWSQSMFC